MTCLDCVTYLRLLPSLLLPCHPSPLGPYPHSFTHPNGVLLFLAAPSTLLPPPPPPSRERVRYSPDDRQDSVQHRQQQYTQARQHPTAHPRLVRPPLPPSKQRQRRRKVRRSPAPTPFRLLHRRQRRRRPIRLLALERHGRSRRPTCRRGPACRSSTSEPRRSPHLAAPQRQRPAKEGSIRFPERRQREAKPAYRSLCTSTEAC